MQSTIKHRRCTLGGMRYNVQSTNRQTAMLWCMYPAADQSPPRPTPFAWPAVSLPQWRIRRSIHAQLPTLWCAYNHIEYSHHPGDMTIRCNRRLDGRHRACVCDTNPSRLRGHRVHWLCSIPDCYCANTNLTRRGVPLFSEHLVHLLA